MSYIKVNLEVIINNILSCFQTLSHAYSIGENVTNKFIMLYFFFYLLLSKY